MNTKKCDVAVIGGGPAGLAAALGAYDAGAKKVIIIERDKHLGGILQQCIHNGFGLHTFGEDLSGPEYAERFLAKIQERPIECLTETMVLDLCGNEKIAAVSAQEEMIEILPKATVLAMGCRERTRGAIALPGQRPAGIFTAGTAQRFINMEGYLPGKRIVIVGSGDIGMIMARRLHLEGAEVMAVIEIMDCIGGLNRNLVQCLQDFSIPLYLSHTVTDIRGRKRVDGISVAPLANGAVNLSGEFSIDCDTLLLSVGLIPENELSQQAGILIDKGTSGPVVDQYFHTSVPGIFAAGNVLTVFDLVDHVSSCAEHAGRSAARYCQNEIAHWGNNSTSILPGEGIRCVTPQRLEKNGAQQEIDLYMRAAYLQRETIMQIRLSDQSVLFEKKFRIARPPEMLSVSTIIGHQESCDHCEVTLQGEQQ